MKQKLEQALGRSLSEAENSKIDLLLGWSPSVIEVFEGLFADLYRAGQADAIIAMESDKAV